MLFVINIVADVAAAGVIVHRMAHICYANVSHFFTTTLISKMYQQ